MVAQPAFDPLHVECHVGGRQFDHHADGSNQLPRDFLQARARRLAPKDAGGQYMTGQQGGDPWRRGARGDITVGLHSAELEVVDDADRVVAMVQQLTIEQMQPRVENPAAVAQLGPIVAAGHWPAPVTIINGIAASDAAKMITRYTEPSRLVSHPLV